MLGDILEVFNISRGGGLQYLGDGINTLPFNAFLHSRTVAFLHSRAVAKKVQFAGKGGWLGMVRVYGLRMYRARVSKDLGA